MNPQLLKAFYTTLLILITITGISVHAKTNPCFPRIGQCIHAVINGENVIPLESNDLLKPYEKISYYVNDVTGYIAKPLSGEIDIKLAIYKGGISWIGSSPEQSIQVIPLERVETETTEKITHDSSVRIDGAASVVKKNVLDSNILPTGKYLLRLKVRGSNNWDRKTIFIEVKQPN